MQHPYENCLDGSILPYHSDIALTSWNDAKARYSNDDSQPYHIPPERERLRSTRSCTMISTTSSQSHQSHISSQGLMPNPVKASYPPNDHIEPPLLPRG
ncbi:unnamed protein product, partial [Rotaria magnacalcarata]